MTFAEAARRAFDDAVARAVALGANVLPPGRRWVVPLALLIEPTAGCVSAKTCTDAIEARDRRLDMVSHDLSTAREKLDAGDAARSTIESESDALRARLEDAATEKDVLVRAVVDARKSLGIEQRRSEGAEARAERSERDADRLRAEIDPGSLDVTIRHGRMVLRVDGDVLFDEARSDLRADAKPVLRRVASVLRTMPHRHFQVAGHTDDGAPRSGGTNWELSAARAIVVVRFLVGEGVPASELSAAGYGAEDPIAPNATPEGRRRNRRVDITVMPELREGDP